MEWQLISGKLNGGAEVLTLKMNGRTFCEFAPGVAPYRHIWISWYKGFPKHEFYSREACIKEARLISNNPNLEVSQ